MRAHLRAARASATRPLEADETESQRAFPSGSSGSIRGASFRAGSEHACRQRERLLEPVTREEGRGFRRSIPRTNAFRADCEIRPPDASLARLDARAFVRSQAEKTSSTVGDPRRCRTSTGRSRNERLDQRPISPRRTSARATGEGRRPRRSCGIEISARTMPSALEIGRGRGRVSPRHLGSEGSGACCRAACSLSTDAAGPCRSASPRAASRASRDSGIAGRRTTLDSFTSPCRTPMPCNSSSERPRPCSHARSKRCRSVERAVERATTKSSDSPSIHVVATKLVFAGQRGDARRHAAGVEQSRSPPTLERGDERRLATDPTVLAVDPTLGDLQRRERTVFTGAPCRRSRSPPPQYARAPAMQTATSYRSPAHILRGGARHERQLR